MQNVFVGVVPKTTLVQAVDKYVSEAPAAQGPVAEAPPAGR